MELKIISGKVSIIVIEYAHGENVGKTGVMSYAKEDPVELSKFYVDIFRQLGLDVSLVDLANKKEIEDDLH